MSVPVRVDPRARASGLDEVVRRRRRQVLVVAAALLVLLAVVVVASAVLGGDPDPAPPEPPPVPAGLLPWVPRGGLAGDAALVGAATALWRAGRTLDGAPVPTPAADVRVLWADKIGSGRVVVLQALGTDGRPYVAQASEHDEPAELGLDTVDELPDDLPVALAISYDGNIDLPGAVPGRGSALVQVLRSPVDVEAGLALWRFLPSPTGGELRRLETKPTGMTKTFLQIDVSDPIGTPVVLTSAVGGQAGVRETITVRGGELVPEPTLLALQDDPSWGPTGVLEGHEYTDLARAAAGLGVVGPATGFVAASVVADVDGEQTLASLVVVQPSGTAPLVACVVGGQTAAPTVTEAVAAGPGVSLETQLVVGAVCARPGTTAPALVGVLGAARNGAVLELVEGDAVLDGPAAPLFAGPGLVVGAGELTLRVTGASGAGSSYELGRAVDVAPVEVGA